MKIKQTTFSLNRTGTPKIMLILLLFLAIGHRAGAQEMAAAGSSEAVQDSLMLHRYIREALENSPRLEALFHLYYARLEQVSQAGALPDPEVMFQYHINPMEGGNPLAQTSVSAMQMFPWFGTLGKRKEQVEKRALVQWTAFEEVRNELVMEVRRQWYRMHELHHHIMIYRQNLDLLEQLENQVRSLYESGRVSQVDLLRIQIGQDELVTRIQNSGEELVSMKAGFNALLDRDRSEEVDLPEVMFTPGLSVSEESLRDVIRTGNPRLRGREYDEAAARAAEEQARLEGLPSIGVGMMVMNRNYMYMPLMGADGPAVTASLTVRLPIYRSKYRAQQQQAHLEAKAAREKQQDLFNHLDAEALSLLQQYRDAILRIELYEGQLIPRTEQALDIAMAEYSSGRTSFEQVIQLQRQLLEYEMELNSAHVEQNIVVAEVEYLAGEYNVTPEEIETD